jgi:hypothetical protein
MKEKFHCEITERKGDQKMVKIKDMQVCMKKLKMKRKGQNNV